MGHVSENLSFFFGKKESELKQAKTCVSADTVFVLSKFPVWMRLQGLKLNPSIPN